MNVAEKKENSAVLASLWNTYHCQSKIQEVDGRYYGNYCKNRFCPLCCSIRKAYIINRYLPVMIQWENPYFVTLTIKAVGKATLPRALKKLIEGFKKITAKYKKRNQRCGSLKLIGIKSLECNYIEYTKTYNPHLHLIVASKEIAQVLVREWLLLWNKGWSIKKAQFIRKVESLERDLIETIKYGNKIFTEPDVKKKTNLNHDCTIHVAALYNIFAAMKGLRIFERFGFNLPRESKQKPVGARRVQEYTEWVYLPEYHD